MKEGDTENNLDRAEALLAQAPQIILKASKRAQQNAVQLSRLEHTTPDLVLPPDDRVEFEEWQRTIQALLDRIDRKLDYLMQRDGDGQA